MSNGFELLPFLSGVGNVLSAGADIGRVLRGPGAVAPAPFVAGAIPSIARTVGAGAAGGFVGSLFGNGNGTPLQRARDSRGRRPSRKQVVTAARVCGLDVAADTYGLSIRDLCEIVSKGLPRRSRGISSSDLRRTRSTLRKMQTARKSLRSLCR